MDDDKPKFTFAYAMELEAKKAEQNSGHPETDKLSVQSFNSGHSETENLDTIAPRKQIWTPRKKKILDTITPRNKNSGHSRNSNWREYENKRVTVRVNIHLHKELDQRVRQYCVTSNPRIDLREFYEQAAAHYLDFLGTQTPQILGAIAPFDERRLMKYKTLPAIISLYWRFTANRLNKWTWKDDEIGAKFNDVDLRLIELGILQTLGNSAKPPKVNSFAYYQNEIEFWLELGFNDEQIERTLELNRNRWKTGLPSK